VALPPLSLYIHVPWCIRKCPYCDFNSHQADSIPEEAYIDALLDDLETDLPLVQGRSVETLFFGGGTPSLLSATALKRLLDGIHSRIDITDHAEITLEANPGTFEQEKFSAYQQAGINRLSIGVQSFQPEQLTILGRIHSCAEATKAAEIAHLAGFKELNLDLMYGLPNQTIASALDDLQQAIALKPTHLSWYQLTIEPNTVFYSKPPTLPEDDNLWDIQEAGQALLKSEEYEQYEISAYALNKQHEQSRKQHSNKHQCQHNNNYWQFGDYLGIGAGAHGKITLQSPLDNTRQVHRYQKTRAPKDYLNSIKPYRSHFVTIPSTELGMEFFMNGLRLNQGVEKQLFFNRTLNTLMPTETGAALKQAIQQGLLIDTKNHWVPTELGRQHLNSLLQLFI